MVATLSDKPFYSLIHLKQDAKSAEEDVANSIVQYKGSTLYNSMRQESNQQYVDVQ